jgi:choline dehydrogenase-like flavoprotein
MAAKVLTESGIRCLMLNAGPVADVSRDAQSKPAGKLPYRGFTPPGRLEHVFQSDEFNANVWVDEQEVPYTFEPAHPYNWVRVRLFGGRSLFWSRQSFRLSDYEFKAHSHDGFGEDWPISLADLAPYYARVEEIFQVEGALDGPPQMPDGNFIIDSNPWSDSMQRFIKAAQPNNMPVCKQRRALGRDGLASSVNLLLPDAEKTGKLTSIANAVVRELTVDKNTGKPNGCNFVDRLTGREMSVKARGCCSIHKSPTPAASSAITLWIRFTERASCARCRKRAALKSQASWAVPPSCRVFATSLRRATVSSAATPSM